MSGIPLSFPVRQILFLEVISMFFTDLSNTHLLLDLPKEKPKKDDTVEKSIPTIMQESQG